MSGEPIEPEPAPPRPTHLSVVWRNPCPPSARRPVDLAAAIERHLSGKDGLTDEQFLRTYSRRAIPARPAWAEAAMVI
jgi:hypothetical protein